MNPHRTGVNLASIAEAAGVSVPTVSKVINNREGVSHQTRQRVQRLVDEAGYQSPQGRRIRTSSRPMIDLVIGDVSDGYSALVLRGVLKHAHEAGIDVVVSSIDPDTFPLTDATDWAERMLESGREGLLAVTSHLSPEQHRIFLEHNLPVVVIDPRNTPSADLPSVGATNWNGGRSATEHLITLGHTRIAFLGGPMESDCNQARLHGYLSAMSNAGLKTPPEYALHAGNFSRRHGRAGAAELLSLPHPPTAIFAASDTIALGVLEEASSRGLSVPNELSLVGFDGTRTSAHTLPPLTTVAQPLADIGRLALKTLAQLIEGTPPASPRIELATELVVRSSTAAPAAKSH